MTATAAPAVETRPAATLSASDLPLPVAVVIILAACCGGRLIPARRWMNAPFECEACGTTFEAADLDLEADEHLVVTSDLTIGYREGAAFPVQVGDVVCGPNVVVRTYADRSGYVSDPLTFYRARTAPCRCTSAWCSDHR